MNGLPSELGSNRFGDVKNMYTIQVHTIQGHSCRLAEKKRNATFL